MAHADIEQFKTNNPKLPNARASQSEQIRGYERMGFSREKIADCLFKTYRGNIGEARKTGEVAIEQKPDGWQAVYTNVCRVLDGKR